MKENQAETNIATDQGNIGGDSTDAGIATSPSTHDQQTATGGSTVPANAGTPSMDALHRIAAQLRRAGATLPLTVSVAPSTMSDATARGLSLALCLVDVEIETERMTTLREFGLSVKEAAGDAHIERAADDQDIRAPGMVKLRPGERYAGIVCSADGKPSHHLILLPGQSEKVTWAAAREFASTAGGELPTRVEQAILFGNARDEFQADMYWSGEQHASGSAGAWYQLFSNGFQYYNGKSAELRARAVRRLPF